MTTTEARSHLVPVGSVCVQLLADSDAIVRMMRNGKVWEPQTRHVWQSLVREGEMVIDVGAYTGIYSIASALMGAKVVAFEPHPANFARLKANAAVNSVRVNALAAAASDQLGSPNLMLYIQKVCSHISDMATLVPTTEAYRISVPSIRIDDLQFVNKVALIKIDAENHELNVLSGALVTIGAHKPAVIVETLNDWQQQAVKGIMTSLGYGLRDVLDGRNGLYVAERV